MSRSRLLSEGKPLGAQKEDKKAAVDHWLMYRIVTWKANLWSNVAVVENSFILLWLEPDFSLASSLSRWLKVHLAFQHPMRNIGTLSAP